MDDVLRDAALDDVIRDAKGNGWWYPLTKLITLLAEKSAYVSPLFIDAFRPIPEDVTRWLPPWFHLYKKMGIL